MFEVLGQFDQLPASLCGVFAGALGCWLVLKLQSRRQQRALRHESRANQNNETPAINAAARAKAESWSEPERLLIQVHEIFAALDTESDPTSALQALDQGKLATRQLQEWLAREKHQRRTSTQDDTAAALRQRAAEDELVLQWLQENPASPAPRVEPAPEVAHPELALTQIASELLPFNPLAGRLQGKSAESDMTAAVERIEKLLASVDPPESLAMPPAGLWPASLTNATKIRDPQGRVNVQPEEPQRRRSDQAIIYDTLLRRCLGDDDFAWRMLRKFPTRCRAELDSLATELRRRAWGAATRRINQLRGIAANIAAENLRDALANLENVCRQQSATRADQLLEGVYSEFQQVLDFLARAGSEPTKQPPTDEHQPLSRWPAGSLPADEHALHPLELPSAARVS